jgi:uncharacterized protein (DUF1501 family)
VPGTPDGTLPSGAGSLPGSPSATLLGGRRLVVVQLNGGNDGLNTVVPLDGRYHDARPTIGLTDDTLVALAGADGIGLHPALAPLAATWEAGRLAIVRGIGFEQPNRSHFVSMDRWWRADDLGGPGWLGRLIDGLPSEPEPLFATALGGGAPLLNGRDRQPTVVSSVGSFRFTGLDARSIAALAQPVDDVPLRALLQHAYERAVAAVTDFADVAGTSPSTDVNDVPTREGGATLADGLALAATLLAADVGTQIVVVSASGFDTHAGQLAVQANLLDDLATGIAGFLGAVDDAGLTDDVLLVTTSEFGRRVAQNGSEGTDHGAGNVSFAVGAGVRGGVYGETDLGDLLDGDVRPVVDPRALYTVCLDWLGADVERVLGSRYDDLPLLRT